VECATETARYYIFPQKKYVLVYDTTNRLLQAQCEKDIQEE
jgi:hypothetical protein